MEVKTKEIFMDLLVKKVLGKTTLLKMICGLTIPLKGEISLFNETSQSGFK